MNTVVREWVERAESDFRVALRENAVTVDPSYDAVCFHAQQCAEKLMKAVLISRGVTPPKTHDLVALNSLLSSALVSWSWPAVELATLSAAAVEYRYPGSSAEEAEADEALDICTRLRQDLLSLLPSPGGP